MHTCSNGFALDRNEMRYGAARKASCCWRKECKRKKRITTYSNILIGWVGGEREREEEEKEEEEDRDNSVEPQRDTVNRTAVWLEMLAAMLVIHKQACTISVQEGKRSSC